MASASPFVSRRSLHHGSKHSQEPRGKRFIHLQNVRVCLNRGERLGDSIRFNLVLHDTVMLTKRIILKGGIILKGVTFDLA